MEGGKTMTAEEIDIVVNASVEKAVKEVQKLLPSIKKQLSGIKKEFDNTKLKEITAKVNVGQIKEQMKKAKKEIKNAFDPNDISGMTIDGKAFKIKNISGYSKEIQKLKGKILSTSKANVETMIPKKQSNTIQQQINTEKLSVGTNMLRKYYAILDMVKLKMSQLKQEINQTATTQNKLGSFFSVFKQKTEQVKKNMSNMKNSFKSLPKVTQNIYNNIKGMGAGLKSGLGNVLKYATALFSLRSIYSALSSSANAWLSSQNSQAKQLSANIEYMKYAMGSMFAPVLEYVTNLVYNLMKAVQSLVYAFSGVNIFAKATASSMKNASGSAKQTSKSLSSVHSEINNVSDNKNSNTSGTPNIDLSNIDSKTDIWIQSLKEKIAHIFQPIQNSWNTYGTAVIDAITGALNSCENLIKTIGKSFKEVWENGTGEQTVNIILQIIISIFNTISNIKNTFAELWKTNNGTEIIQQLWNGFNNLLSLVLQVYQTFEEWSKSTNFQEFAKAIINICDTLSKWFEIITEKLKEIWENGGKHAFTSLLEFISKLVTAVSSIISTLTPVVRYILDTLTPVISGIVDAIGYVIDALSGVLDFIIGAFSGDWERAWNGIKEFFIGIWNALKTIVVTIFNIIKDIIMSVLNVIKNIWNNVWNGLKTTVTSIFNGIWNTIKRIINSILGGIEGMANGVVKGINKVISVMNNLSFDIPDWVPGMGGKKFGFNIGYMSEVSLPRLAKGNVAYEKTLAIFGEYAGASNNPEITTPQNIMRETFEDVLSNYNNENSDRPINLTVNVGNAKLGQILLDNLRDMKRQSGKDIEALVGG
jgi:phage-related protein